MIRLILKVIFIVGLANLTGCATVMSAMVQQSRMKVGDQVSCDKHRSLTGLVSAEDCEKVNERIQKEFDLKEARVGFDLKGKGRLQLAGDYKNEEEVQRVFALAQAMVGSQWVSPVKPGHIKVEAWQQCFKKKLQGKECPDWNDTPYSLDRKPPGPVRNRYALIVGVGQFKNPISHLKFAANDADIFADYLTDPKRGNFSPANVTKLTNEQATRQAILDGLGNIENRVQGDDLVVVYFSSHGAPPNDFGHVNILTYDTDVPFIEKKRETLSWKEKVLQRESVWASSVPRQRLKEFFVNMAAKGVKRVLMVLDVCFSGDALNEFPGFRPAASEALARSEESFATGYSPEQLAEILGAKDLSMDAPNDTVASESPLPRRGTGRAKKSSQSVPAKDAGWGQVIMSASSEKEKSWEPTPKADMDITNSYFTHYFLESLDRTGGRVQDSFTVAVPLVRDMVNSEKGASQQPQSHALPDVRNWNFSLNSGARR